MNKDLIRWVEKMADLTQPERIHWIEGSQASTTFARKNTTLAERTPIEGQRLEER
jgi:hypothetical protein